MRSLCKKRKIQKLRNKNGPDEVVCQVATYVFVWMIVFNFALVGSVEKRSGS